MKIRLVLPGPGREITRIMKRTIVFALAALFPLILLLYGFLWFRYGGGEHAPALTTAPLWQDDVLEKVADLDRPPGNIAVSRDGEVYFTFHPEGAPDINVARLTGDAAKAADDATTPIEAYPNLEFQSRFVSPLSLRIDQQNRLWVLDLANHATGTPKIFAFSLADDSLLMEYEIPADIAPLGSHMNDMQIDSAGEFMYIADASIFGKNPALIVFDIKNKSARRLLENHPSVTAEHFISTVGGREMVMLGFFVVRPHVDSIALDTRDEWLYYAAVNAQHMYRIRVKYLRDERLSARELARKVERFARKSHSDGITMDSADNIYLSDPEYNAVNVLNARGEFKTLITSPKLRWPDGFSFGPDGFVYVTCSALHHVIFQSRSYQSEHEPFQIYRFPGLAPGVAGH
ncbi:MAG: L-dopachrome tautomerase-related protein [Leptospirales bacterium]